MLRLAKRTEYALLALVHLARRGGAVVSARQVGEAERIPPRLAAEVLKDLQRAGLVRSSRGAAGGYRLARPPAAISLADVAVALEREPPAPPSPRSPAARIHDGVRRLLDGTTIAELAAGQAGPVPAEGAAGAEERA